MQKSKIEWTDFVWNPIKGICPVGCWYCYAKNIYTRFKMDPAPRLDANELTAPYYWADTKKRIFVCSTFDLFHPVADKWRDDIFEVIESRLDFTFIILTKLPQNIDRPMPPNVWLGVSITEEKDSWRWKELQQHKASTKFVSMEPLLGRILFLDPVPSWVILGRLTGHGKENDPPIEQLSDMYDRYNPQGIPLFMKSNLAGIWPGPLIQEFPNAIEPGDGSK